ncbi:hypothetical protein GCM10009727_76300 [Actinomadura napierensis]|uniref:MFS transporter n=1 Tax=Actinomadura napierensis TaxID=267854 RepID=A0ABN3ADR6_9ACTN
MFPRATYTFTSPTFIVMQAVSAMPLIFLHLPDLMSETIELDATEAVGQALTVAVATDLSSP